MCACWLLQLLDEGSPFLELSPLAGKDLYGELCHDIQTKFMLICTEPQQQTQTVPLAVLVSTYMQSLHGMRTWLLHAQ